MSIAHKINDRLIKLLSIPVIAIGFSNISRLIVNNRYGIYLLLLQYVYFIFLVYVLWQGNILVVLLIKRKMNLDKISYHKYILTIIISTVIYAVFIVGSMLTIWTKLFIENYTTSHILVNAILVLVFIATFITIIYENYLLNRKKLSALS
jgi:hypothetical protein